MTSCTVSSVSKCKKVTLIHICEPKKNLVRQDQVMLQISRQFQLWLCDSFRHTLGQFLSRVSKFVCLSVRLSVRLSVTFRYQMKTA